MSFAYLFAFVVIILWITWIVFIHGELQIHH